MKLILIPDNPKSTFGGPLRPKVAISIPGDDHTIHDILEKLVTPALVAMSFHPQTIQDGYRDAEVMGARDEESDDLTEWSTPANAPKPPEGFTVVGFGVDCSGPDNTLWDDNDLVWWNDSLWFPTRVADGGYWYAARNETETLAKLQAHVAATR